MPTSRKRNRIKQLNLRLTDAEAVALSASADAVQQPFSVYARERLLHGITTGEKRRVMSAESAVLIRMLTRVGERLNYA
jgi:DNA topoisomerase IB